MLKTQYKYNLTVKFSPTVGNIEVTEEDVDALLNRFLREMDEFVEDRGSAQMRIIVTEK